MASDLDDRIRSAAFAYLDALTARSGGLVSRAELEAMPFEGGHLRLIAAQQGIWRPRFLDSALSILTTFVRPGEVPPYEDQEMGADNYPRYKWRGPEGSQSDNVGLRRAMDHRRPLIWFIGVRPGLYRARYPVWLAGEEPDEHQFAVALDETMRDAWRPGLVAAPIHDPARRYAEVLVRQRLHQRVFHDRVMPAYGSQCALCRLRHPRLLDAAHIKEDSDGGEPIVPNGVAMCAIHHRAFDAFVLGVRPDYKIEIRKDVLVEHDGPTLQHALQGLHEVALTIPVRTSNGTHKELHEERFKRFLAAS